VVQCESGEGETHCPLVESLIRASDSA